jgi:hypothetical protein
LVRGVFNFKRLCLNCVFVVWCMAPLAPAKITIRRAVVHPWYWVFSIRGAYFLSFSITF